MTSPGRTRAGREPARPERRTVGPHGTVPDMAVRQPVNDWIGHPGTLPRRDTPGPPTSSRNSSSASDLRKQQQAPRRETRGAPNRLH